MTRPGRPCPVVVIGASAGGVEALQVLIGGLPRGLSAAVVVVLHLAPGGPSVLPQILARAGALPVVAATDGVRLIAGTVYVGPANYHVLVDGDTLNLTVGPPKDHHRPSIDLLFSSAAATVGPATIGVVLSGALRDGAEGLAAITAAGGHAVVQNPATANYPDMPRNALAAVPDALQLPLDDIAAEIVRICSDTAVAPPG